MLLSRPQRKFLTAASGPILLLGLTGSGSGVQSEAASDPRCEALAQETFGVSQVLSATTVRGGAWISPDGQTVTDLPPLCRVSGIAAPTPRSRIGFEVWLPLEDWSTKIHMVGNGGYSASIRFGLMGSLVRRGDVAVATDTGHQGDDLSFGFGNRDAIEDWGHRAVHHSIQSGKSLAARFYGTAPRRSYFSGCSTGGHQGLMSAQRYPEDFDGIIAGAPGNNRTNLNFGFLWQFVSNRPFGRNQSPILDEDDLQLVGRTVMEQCDALDGVRDGIVSDPRQCPFEPSSLRCAPGQAEACLTQPKIDALTRMYTGARRSDTGEVIYPGWPVGSEFVQGQGLSEGWHRYWSNPRKPDEPQRVDFFRHWLFDDPRWNWWNFDWAKGVDHARAVMGPLVDATNPDLDDFRTRGGKLILFTGWQDPVVSAYDVISYYEDVTAHQGGDATDFARLFLVPGMGHCALGAGATNFSTSTRNSAPLHTDSEHDITRALEEWVEDGRPPDQVTAVKYAEGRRENGPVMTRPLCPYPQVAEYDGRGDPNDAGSFICR